MEDRNAFDFSQRPVLKVFGVGGGGNNSVNRMILQDVKGVTYCAINTDSKALRSSQAEERIRIGKELTGGLGAGANPEKGRQAIEENIKEVEAAMEGVNLAFVTCGMGGGTGTGAAPIVAKIAKEKGALVVGVVTKPFKFEGERRMHQAEVGINEIRPYCDSLIIVPNDKVLENAGVNTSATDAFIEVDNVVLRAIQGIATIVDTSGTIIVDFNDLKTVIENKGTALIGIGTQSGPNRGVEAVRKAIQSPLLEIDINGATDAILQVIAPKDFTILEFEEVSNELRRASSPDINLIVGLAYDEKVPDGEVSVIIVASGFDQNKADEQGQPQVKPAGEITNHQPTASSNNNAGSKVPDWLQNDKNRK